MSKLPAGLALATDSPSRLYLVHPTNGGPLTFKVPGADGAPRVAWIDLLSADSGKLRALDRATGNARIEAARRARNRVPAVTIEQVESEALERLIAATAAWDLCTLDGEPIADFPCSPENARALYQADVMAWLREQVQAFIEDRANFKTASSTS